LLKEVEQYYPTAFSAEDLREANDPDHISGSIVAEALEYYHGRDEHFPGGADEARAVEREIMLQIIDQRWRDHLAEMDYLREGINLRAMGQQDPLVAWQREGFEMFGQMIDAIDDDYLRYVLHVQVITEQAPEPDLAQASYQAADDPVHTMAATMAGALGNGAGVAPPAPAPAAAGVAAGRTTPVEGGEDAQVPLVKAPSEKLGRNQPCWCGSGKKYKLCHGAA
jgi:preprotein translocase subunit SecA